MVHPERQELVHEERMYDDIRRVPVHQRFLSRRREVDPHLPHLDQTREAAAFEC